MRRILTSALTVLVAAAVPAAANAQLPQIPQLPASSSSNFQDEINHRIDDARAQVEDITSKAFPQKAPKQKAPTPAKKTEPRNSGGVDCANCVAITYDDGPGAETNRLLDKLKAKNAHASFMVIAPSAEQHPELLKRMKAEGHTIGNHTKSHRQLNTLSYEQVSQEIDAGNAAISKATGQGTRWVRPPYGATNATVDQATRDKGVSQALWDVDTVDWKDRNSDHVCSSAVQGAHAGSIVLMHDIHPTTVDAADCVIDGLRAKGLEPVSLDRLLRTPVPGKRYYARG
ncbi:polysaccharide deacetylase family protein [Corynebacterium tuberculostearicum]|uniref:polysaccharide deacetylase family protein n=1 Tax=Corynebacterium tuberculostearicum TaxID=38304 RepID=UPI00195E8916|nr:polysaccharide deacetylase family protein [Corynebacterium tuberculostearicum]MDV2428569.1 polysaccharide deacetylase family protein [Corynebacterium tuberculostearicum]MDV2431189.1 polysaccharide deacetylase family protein [Corynebacterium tuberculostearicum]MDV2435566.1 polysaccharide deacetylase family protein [Corynebacterium tuberculostearicum]QRQ67633.1 polysaccharide deacetylase family protein [Corynebacterium tuberculostearicum]